VHLDDRGRFRIFRPVETGGYNGTKSAFADCVVGIGV
jgi:hypothetical protein